LCFFHIVIPISLIESVMIEKMFNAIRLLTLLYVA